MEKDQIYAVPEIQEALDGIDLAEEIVLPVPFETDPFVERCCDKPDYNCSSKFIELRYVKYQGDVCWIVWPSEHFFYIRCTCCTCVLDDLCPTVGRCVETDYRTIKVVAYCPHIMCPLPQTFFYQKLIW
nr:hypothetical protein BaRGS_021648 [Batillaria attramentaria]